jgi:DNA polymerase III delta subunit
MHSKWQIWDFFTSFNSISTSSGLAVYTTFDPLVSRMIKEKISETINLRTFWGHEISRDWLESELTGLNLFGAPDPIFIYEADTLSSDVREYILNLKDSELQTLIILTMESTTNFAKAIQKANAFTVHTIESPRFWEINKLIDFLANWFRLKIAYNAKNEILQMIDHDILALFHAMNTLSVNFQNQSEITRDQVLSVLEKERLDTFEIGLLFCKKQYSQFADKLLSFKIEQKKLLDFFRFMHGHLLKVKDPSNLQKKDRLTLYDKEILNVKKLWKDDELDHWIQHFSHLEILAKQKDSSLISEIKKFYFIK